MDEDVGFILLVICFVAVMAVVSIMIFSAPPPDIINAEDIYKYDGMKIQTTVTIDHHITDRTEFEYMMMIPICTSTGKTVICNYIFVPIFDDYSVYKIKEGYYIANDFGYDFQDGQTYEIIGRVEHDYNDEHLFCVVVYEVLPA